MYDAYIFDLDGLLIDTESIAMDAGLEVLGAMGHAVGRDFMLSLIGIDEAEGHRRLVAHLGRDVDFAALGAAWSNAVQRRQAKGIPVKAGAAQLLDALVLQNRPRAVATNSRTANAERKLDMAGLRDRVEIVVGFDAVPRPKPAPDVYVEAARRLGAQPARCVAFEDSDTGVAAAIAAGMTVIQIPDLVLPGNGDAHHRAVTLTEAASLLEISL